MDGRVDLPEKVATAGDGDRDRHGSEQVDVGHAGVVVPDAAQKLLICFPEPVKILAGLDVASRGHAVDGGEFVDGHIGQFHRNDVRVDPPAHVQ